MPPPSPLPKYIYKILPSTPYYSFPIPIPASHEFVLSPLDAADGFLHFSTTDQLEGTLSRFFTKDEKVMLLKCDLERLSSWKVLKWDESPSGVFPHLYARLEGENVESFKEVIRRKDGEKEEDWSTVLERAKQEGWLIY